MTTTLAVGGTRSVPEPDPIARDYLLLALRLDQHIPGFVDGYYGPADLKAIVDTEQLRPPGRLRDDAAELLARLDTEVAEADRRDWLRAQLVALRTHAAGLAGEALPYLDHVEHCFDYRPQRHDEADFAEAATELDGLLPGDGPLPARQDAWDARLEIPADRIRPVVDWLVERFRERARGLFGLPDGEGLTFSLVTNQPWSGYNWYDGGLRSRFDLNTDLPIRAGSLVSVAAHEAYPGHHLEHAWKEADLVLGRRRLEASVMLINTPECLISEGLADLGERFAAPEADRVDLLVELFAQAGLAVASDPVESRIAAERQVAIAAARRRLAGHPCNAAFLRHVDGAGHDEVVAYIRDVGCAPQARAEKLVEFLEHPLWRTYIFVYHEGEALLRRWLEKAPEADRPARFGRLLHEQLTPTAIVREIDRA